MASADSGGESLQRGAASQQVLQRTGMKRLHCAHNERVELFANEAQVAFCGGEFALEPLKAIQERVDEGVLCEDIRE